MENSESKIKQIFDKLIDSTYKVSNLKSQKPEVELVQDLTHLDPTSQKPYLDVYINAFTTIENNFDFYIFKRKLEKRISAVFGKRFTIRLFFNTDVPKKFDSLKSKADEFKTELQRVLSKKNTKDFHFNVLYVEPENTNWVGGNRMSVKFIVEFKTIDPNDDYITDWAKSELQLALMDLFKRFPNSGFEGYSHYIDIDELYDFNDSVEGEEDYDDEDVEELSEEKLNIKDVIKKNTDKIKNTFKEELKNSNEDAKLAFKHLVSKKKDLTKEERDEISKELKSVFLRTAKRLGLVTLFMLPGGLILSLLLHLFTKKKDVPYEETITENSKIRVFSESVDTNELKWHRDREDRLVEIIEGGDWELQFDDELPFKLKKGMSVIIPEGVYHRVIKGEGNLKVKITRL